MEIAPEVISEDYFRGDIVKQERIKNKVFLKLAVTNVSLAKKLGLKEGLVYDCKDNVYFNIRLPSGEMAFSSGCRYGFQESRSTLAGHYVFLKNKWEVPVKLEKVVGEISIAYQPLTGDLRCGIIRNSLAKRVYSRKLFEFDESENTIRPTYLPVDIEL